VGLGVGAGVGLGVGLGAGVGASPPQLAVGAVGEVKVGTVGEVKVGAVGEVKVGAVGEVKVGAVGPAAAKRRFNKALKEGGNNTHVGAGIKIGDGFFFLVPLQNT